MMIEKARRFLPRLFVAAGIVALFFWSAGFGLRTALGDDDVMNLDFSWVPPLRKLVLGLLVPFTGFYRPTGAAAYHLIFDVFGFYPYPFRIFVYALLLLNLYLVYRLGFALAKSREIGMLAAVLYTFHGRLDGIYLNNGTIYDVLCASFTLLLLLYYIQFRQAGFPVTLWRGLITVFLFVLALNAKEMAAICPVLLVLYELLYRETRVWSRAAALSLVKTLWPALISGVLVVMAAYAKTGKDSVMHGNPAYAMTFTLNQFMEHWRRLLSGVVYSRPGINQLQTAMIWVFLLGAAAVIRRKYLSFFVLFALIAPLPVVFIPYRDFFVMYLPLAGWALSAAAISVAIRDWLCSRLPKAAQAFGMRGGRMVLVALAVFWIIGMPRIDANPQLQYEDPSHVTVASMRDDILNLGEPLPKGAMILFLHDRFPRDSWNTRMLLRLLYRDPHLLADRPTMMKQAPTLAAYDTVFDYVNGKLAVVHSRPRDPANVAELNRPR